MHNTFDRFYSLLAVAALAFALASCSSSSSPTSSGSYTPITVTFTQNANARYDFNYVSTPDSSGNNGDQLINDSTAQSNVLETVTSVNYPLGGFNCVASVFMKNPVDTDYFYQDASGNLWKYNYGFSQLNAYTFLTQLIGSQINVGWVLVAKPGSPVGTTWTGKLDTAVIQSFGAPVYLKDVATTMKDTIFNISNDTIRAIHVQHNVTASTAPGAGQTVGEIKIDLYFSTALGMTVEDFFHYSTITGSLYNGKQKGSRKIMVVK